VKVVERRKVVGGAAVTEEFHPGFRNSVAAYTVSLLNPQIIADLRLHDHGLKIVERRAQNFLPAPDGSYLVTGEVAPRLRSRDSAPATPPASMRSRANSKPSPTCCGNWCCARRRTWSKVLAWASISEALNAFSTANIFRGLTLEQQRTLLDLFTRSAGEILDETFESDLVKALFGFDASSAITPALTRRGRPM